MREKHTVQSSIFEFYPDHEIGQDLQSISNTLDVHPDWLGWVEADVEIVMWRRLAEGAVGRAGVALCTAKAVSTTGLHGVGVLSDGLISLPGICSIADGVFLLVLRIKLLWKMGISVSIVRRSLIKSVLHLILRLDHLGWR
jgi:hypothetical protein